ncbi:MAG TPA: proline dehydrogenase family protein [Rhodothermales bacterium]|nr:proline dehydrogenase family protein [Rhodothermales bacterium]
MKLPFVLARRFVAGETFEQALPAVKKLNRQGLHASVDLLGEYVHDRNIALSARDAYMDLVRTIARERQRDGLDANISIKLSMLGQKIEAGFCVDNLRQLLEAAKNHDVFVRLDMEGSDITESTLSIFEAVYPQYPDHVGPVLQAYLHRTEQDVRRIIKLRARVRLCKGAYKEPADIAYQDMSTIRARYIDSMKLLLEHGRYPGIATHDDQIIRAAKQFAAAEEIGRDRFEFQMLYGIRPRTQVQTAREGYNMRVYVPFGTQWVPYFSRRLRERKENVWFVLKNVLRG